MLRNFLCREKSGRLKKKKKVKIFSSCAYRLIDEYENPLLWVFVGSFTVNFGLCLLSQKRWEGTFNLSGDKPSSLGQ